MKKEMGIEVIERDNVERTPPMEKAQVVRDIIACDANNMLSGGSVGAHFPKQHGIEVKSKSTRRKGQFEMEIKASIQW